MAHITLRPGDIPAILCGSGNTTLQPVLQCIGERVERGGAGRGAGRRAWAHAFFSRQRARRAQRRMPTPPGPPALRSLRLAADSWLCRGRKSSPRSAQWQRVREGGAAGRGGARGERARFFASHFFRALVRSPATRAPAAPLPPSLSLSLLALTTSPLLPPPPPSPTPPRHQGPARERPLPAGHVGRGDVGHRDAGDPVQPPDQVQRHQGRHDDPGGRAPGQRDAGPQVRWDGGGGGWGGERAGGRGLWGRGCGARGSRPRMHCAPARVFEKKRKNMLARSL